MFIEKSVTDELQDLALYLCRQLRSSHISCLLLPSVAKDSLELQRQKYDQLGVPFVVVLNEGTLKNGLALLRSRDTTLKVVTLHVKKSSFYAVVSF